MLSTEAINEDSATWTRLLPCPRRPALVHAQAVKDHLKCYQVKDALNLAARVDLASPQFGLEAGCKVGKAKYFCVPAEKTVISAEDKKLKQPIVPLPVTGPDAGDRICYKVKCPAPAVPIADQTVTDQFGTRIATKFKASFVCTPAVKGSEYCGDGVKNGTEECDGTDAAACPGACQAACTCPTPRFVDNGNGTVTDNETRLQWGRRRRATPFTAWATCTRGAAPEPFQTGRRSRTSSMA